MKYSIGDKVVIDSYDETDSPLCLPKIGAVVTITQRLKTEINKIVYFFSYRGDERYNGLWEENLRVATELDKVLE